MASDIPQWAIEMAQAFHDRWETGMSGSAFRDLARAITEAEARGAERMKERAAAACDTRTGPFAEGSIFGAGMAFAATEIATAIRNLEPNNAQ